MKTTRSTSRILGILFLTVMISWGIGYALIESILSAPDYLQHIFPGKIRVIIGVLFEIVEIAAVMGIVILMFPILRNFNENLARGYLVFRILESLMLITIALSALILITVSQLYISSPANEDLIFQTLGKLLISVRNEWGHMILTPFYGTAAIILNYMLFKTRLVPRFISIWGFGAATFVLINQVVIAIVSYKLEFIPGALMGLNELFLGIWLIAKGFNYSSDYQTFGRPK